ncbi:HNH endonuclease [Candidatus Babeliales bacterium]|nr:HNH endonuclease [Candidatus Babeliales bacterium]
MLIKKCYYEGCYEAAEIEGLCPEHYNLWIGNIKYAYGKPNLSFEECFWSRVWKPTKSSCWLWRGELVGAGYGRLRMKEKSIRAHRFSWEFHYGTIPKDMNVLHKCDNPPCVNPKHLWLGTQNDNIIDSVRKERSCKLTEDKVLEIRKLLKSSSFTHNTIAKMFNISQSLVSCIKLYKIWNYPKILRLEING